VLVEEGAVEQDPPRRYLIGGEVSLLGLARSTRFPIRAIAEPHLRHLSEVLGDTAFLTIRNGADSCASTAGLAVFRSRCCRSRSARGARWAWV
jgi:DNA-binding IclR family transcriptional regulator